ncbi:MAG: hypothetical protein U1F43_30660 [Myxococcota bacterium]
MLSEFTVTSVVPHYESLRSKTNLRRIRGAEIAIQAAPGITVDWLRLQIARYLADMGKTGAMPDCVLDVRDMRGREVLRRARTLAVVPEVPIDSRIGW